jgi:hypothetical protein
VIDSFVEEGALRRIGATVIVEREAHKGMIIGDKGLHLKRIASEARQELERLLEARSSSRSGSRCARAGRIRRAPALLRLRVSAR